MGTKANPSRYDCYEAALPDEPMFVLLGRDKFASALVRLWANMREREGENQLVIQEARQVADDLEQYATNLSKPVITSEALASFIAVTTGMKRAEQERLPPETYAPKIEWQEGEHACTIHSQHIGIFEKYINVEGQPPLAQVRYSATQAPTIPVDSLRKPTREELDHYYSQRGRY